MKKMLILVFAMANTVVYAQSKKQQIVTLNDEIITLNNRVDSFRLALSNETQVKLKNETRDSQEISDLGRQNKELKTVNDNFSLQNSALQEKYDELLLKLDNVISVANDTFSKMQKKIELLEQQIEDNITKASDFRFNLIESNQQESPVPQFEFLADYKIQLLYGNSVIAVFDDYGSASLSDEKDIVWIRTETGSERTYSLQSKTIDEVSITQNFFLGSASIDRDVWTKTYKNYSHWELMRCEGDCE